MTPLLNCSWPSWYASRQQHRPVLQDQSKLILEECLPCDSESAVGPGDRGHAWFPAPSYPRFIPSPSWLHHVPRRPSPPPKLRSLCLIAEEPLVKLGVGVGRPRSVGIDLSSPGASGTHLSSDCPPGLLTSATIPRKASSPHSLHRSSLSLGPLGALCSPPPGADRGWDGGL